MDKIPEAEKGHSAQWSVQRIVSCTWQFKDKIFKFEIFLQMIKKK